MGGESVARVKIWYGPYQNFHCPSWNTTLRDNETPRQAET